MRMFYSILFSAMVILGCARVQVEAPKDPIKMDISMRLDVYQHVVKDIDEIENIVSGDNSSAAKKLSDILIPPAHAESLDPAVKEAALRRKDRWTQISALEAQGILGESQSALLVAKQTLADAENLIREENRDRMTIYESIAKTNGTSVSQVQKLYAERLKANAPAGTPLEKSDGSWEIKS